jgi:hypothetical protein
MHTQVTQMPAMAQRDTGQRAAPEGGIGGLIGMNE